MFRQAGQIIPGTRSGYMAIHLDNTLQTPVFNSYGADEMSIFLGHVLYIVTVILVGEQHPSEAYMLMPFAVTSILIFVLL